MTLLACLHDRNKSVFFGRPDFFFSIQSEPSKSFLNCFDWLDKIPFLLDMKQAMA